METIQIPDTTCPEAVKAKELALATRTAEDIEKAIRAKLRHKHLTRWSYRRARLYPGDWQYRVSDRITIEITDTSEDPT
ncbi:hypothetical protein [Kocuria sp.]|uniref:hypothetical protein n=1 Tax=Kocuria sp. TaxID=1871328 RepID=UPI0026E0A856|nr:hypothetical protein [Kocuria sp.]MDO5619289.1 hypothetical protein [Kocuria sp.]